MLRKIILLAAILCVYSQQQQPAGGTGTGTGTGTQGTGTQQGAGGTGTQQGGTGTQQGGTGAPTQGGQQNGTTTGTQGGQQQGGQQNGTQGGPQNGTQGGQQNGTQGGNGTQPPACGNQTNGTNATNATNSTNSTNQTCQQGNQQGGNQRPPQNQTRPTSGFQEIRPPRNGSGDGSANCTGGQIPIQGNCMSQACGPLSNIVQPDQDKDGTKRVPIRFRANVTLSSGNLLVSIDFPDQQNASVISDQCANTTLTRYSPGFTNGVVVTDPIDKSQYVNGKRIWTFTIANANIKSYLFNDTTNASSVVNGFYGYSITVGTQVVLQYQFNFRLVFDQTGTSLKDVRILDQAPGQTCVSGNCITQAKSQLLWCSDSTCTNTSTTAPSELVVGNSVYVKQIITQTGFTSQKVDNITVVVTGDNVTRTFTVTNLQVYEGYTISEFKLSVIANNVSITLSGNLQPILNTSTTTGTTRFLQSTTTTTSGTTTSTDSMTVQQAQVVATASTGTCIKTTAGGSCPTSDQVSQYNANACGSTSVCSQYSYGAILALALAMIMA